DLFRRHFNEVTAQFISNQQLDQLRMVQTGDRLQHSRHIREINTAAKIPALIRRSSVQRVQKLVESCACAFLNRPRDGIRDGRDRRGDVDRKIGWTSNKDLMARAESGWRALREIGSDFFA